MNTINNDIFHNWKPREVAAMNRATAWLRAMQSNEWNEDRIKAQKDSNIIKIPPYKESFNNKPTEG